LLWRGPSPVGEKDPWETLALVFLELGLSCDLESERCGDLVLHRERQVHAGDETTEDPRASRGGGKLNLVVARLGVGEVPLQDVVEIRVVVDLEGNLSTVLEATDVLPVAVGGVVGGDVDGLPLHLRSGDVGDLTDRDEDLRVSSVSSEKLCAVAVVSCHWGYPPRMSQLVICSVTALYRTGMCLSSGLGSRMVCVISWVRDTSR